MGIITLKDKVDILSRIRCNKSSHGFDYVLQLPGGIQKHADSEYKTLVFFPDFFILFN